MTEIITWIIIAFLIVVIINFLDCIPIPFIQSLTKPLKQLKNLILKIFLSTINIAFNNIKITGTLIGVIIILYVLYELGIIN